MATENELGFILDKSTVLDTVVNVDEPMSLLTDLPVRITTANRLRGLAIAARPKQWIKNFVCFAGLVFAGILFHPRPCLRARGVCQLLPRVVERLFIQ